jgi:hypothetical protein
MYKGASFTYSWGIYVNTASSNNPYSASISSDGSVVLVQLDIGTIIVISAIDGTLIKAINHPYTFSRVNYPYRTLGMNSGKEIIASGNGLVSFLVTSTSYKWYKYPGASLSTMGIVFGNPDTSYVAYFAKGTSNCYLSLIR